MLIQDLCNSRGNRSRTQNHMPDHTSPGGCESWYQDNKSPNQHNNQAVSSFETGTWGGNSSNKVQTNNSWEDSGNNTWDNPQQWDGRSNASWKSGGKNSSPRSHGQGNKEDALSIKINKDDVPRLIGKGGSKIRDLQETSGARIQVRVINKLYSVFINF